MAGHSKWANTKHRKAAQDTKRGKIFTKITRELLIASRLGSYDPVINPRLRAAIDKALLNNMNRETLNRAMSRGVKNDNNNNTETIIYEGYGPGGTAVIVECLSDNRNRTVSEVRHAFTKTNGNLGTDGSVSYLFTKRYVITYAQGVNADSLINNALEAGADDLKIYDNGTIDIYIKPEIFSDVKNNLNAAGFTSKSAEMSMEPLIKIELTIEKSQKLLLLIDLLEDCNDVQKVYHNGVISKTIIEKL
ncbi:putative transcriptional regulatory protein YebC [Candidatus Hartigia pinicola]|nr:putative transcriptional regulatory protein YebC [Candidatus Hartigia pinicola]